MEEIYLNSIINLYKDGVTSEESFREKLKAFQIQYEKTDEEITEIIDRVIPKTGRRIKIENLKKYRKEENANNARIRNSWISGIVGIGMAAVGFASLASLSGKAIFASFTYLWASTMGLMGLQKSVVDVATSIKEKVQAKRRYKIEKTEENRVALKKSRSKIFGSCVVALGMLGVTAFGVASIGSVGGWIASKEIPAAVSTAITATGGVLAMSSAIDAYDANAKKANIEDKIVEEEAELGYTKCRGVA